MIAPNKPFKPLLNARLKVKQQIRKGSQAEMMRLGGLTLC
jgi:hypothetical protein